jgi:uncharacterized protein (DUF2252 family)
MLHAVSRAILRHNAGRDSVLVALKFARLRQDPFAFFRGTNHLFLGHLGRTAELRNAPAAWVCGDLHLENFGTYKGDNRLCYFDINDFDEACLAPVSIDIARFVTSLHLAAPVLKWSAAGRDSVVAYFLRAYRDALLTGKPRWVERSLAEGPVRLLLKRAMARTRTQLLDRYCVQRRKGRRLRIDDERLFAATAREMRMLRGLFRRLGRAAGAEQLPGFYHLLDAAHRVAGNASLGSARFAVLVNGRGPPSGHFILDLKAALPSDTAHWGRLRQPGWANDAQRIAQTQQLLQAIAPALLREVPAGGSGYVLKELQPSLDRLDLAALSAKMRRLRHVAAAMGAVTAWAHLRGAGHRGAATREALQRYVASPRWSAALQRQARGCARHLLADWKHYAADYDAGRIVY